MFELFLVDSAFIIFLLNNLSLSPDIITNPKIHEIVIAYYSTLNTIIYNTFNIVYVPESYKIPSKHLYFSFKSNYYYPFCLRYILIIQFLCISSKLKAISKSHILSNFSTTPKISVCRFRFICEVWCWKCRNGNSKCVFDFS